MSESKVTFCRICEACCGLIASVDGGVVTKLEPDPEHVTSQGYVCVKGIRYLDVHNSKDRLTQPMKRVGNRFEPISWEQALSEIGAKLAALHAEHGASSLGMFFGNPTAFNAPHALFAAAFMGAFKSPNVFSSGSQDCNNKFAASQAMYGSPVIQPIPDLDHAECLILIGTNPAISQMSFIHAPRPIERLKAVEKRGGRVVFVNPRRTESAQQVGEQLFIRPDTDVFFLLAFAQELLQTGGVDPSLSDYFDNEAAFREIIQAWTPERSAEVTGIAAADLRSIVASYREANGAALFCSTGLNQGRHGTLAYWLLNAINAISGNLDRRGGLLVPRAQSRMAQVFELTGGSKDTARSRIGDFPHLLGTFPAAILPDEILTRGEGQLRGFVVTAGNPALSCANSDRIQKALAELELLVCIDLFRNETGNLAHYLLPATSWLERDDVPLATNGFSPTPYLQYTKAVVEPSSEAKDEWWILAKLAEAAGVHMFQSRLMQAYLNASANESVPGFLRFSPRMVFALHSLSNGTTLGTLDAKPHGVRLEDHPERDFIPKRVRRPKHKIDLAPDEFVRAAQGLGSVFLEELKNKKRLKLITKRERTSHNSWMHNVESFVKPPRDTNYLFMHPGDAAERGLADGDMARVQTPTGAVDVPVKHSDDLMLGTVALPHGWGHQASDGLSFASKTRGVNANLLAADGPGAVERFGGMAHLTGLVVAVEKSRAAGLDSAPAAEE